MSNVNNKNSEYTHSVGRRKSASARIRLKKGNGVITVNDRTLEDFVPVEIHRNLIFKPLEIVNAKNDFDVSIKVLGGGQKGQTDAIALGIARALIKYNVDYRPALKAAGLLTRNAREKERKKPGLKKARKAPQWSKR